MQPCLKLHIVVILVEKKRGTVCSVGSILWPLVPQSCVPTTWPLQTWRARLQWHIVACGADVFLVDVGVELGHVWAREDDRGTRQSSWNAGCSQVDVVRWIAQSNQGRFSLMFFVDYSVALIVKINYWLHMHTGMSRFICVYFEATRLSICHVCGPPVQLDPESGTICRRTSDSRTCHTAVSESCWRCFSLVIETNTQCESSLTAP